MTLAIDAFGSKHSAAQIARDCLVEADGDWKVAARIFKKRIEFDAALFKEVAESMIDEAIWQQIKRAAYSQRQSFWSASVKAGEDDTKGIEQMAHKNLLEYPLSGGLKLRDATKNKLKEEAEMHDTFAESNASKARWYRLIIKAMGGADVVGLALNEVDLENLREKAKKG